MYSYSYSRSPSPRPGYGRRPYSRTAEAERGARGEHGRRERTPSRAPRATAMAAESEDEAVHVQAKAMPKRKAAPPPPPPDPVALGHPPMGSHGATLVGCRRVELEVPQEAMASHRPYTLGIHPVFLSDVAIDINMAFTVLGDALTECAAANWPAVQPQITLVSKGYEYREMAASERQRYGQRSRLACSHTWDCTFANDPAQVHRRSGASQAAGKYCVGTSGPIQAAIANYESFEELVRAVRAQLTIDLIAPFLNGREHRPRPIVYGFECKRGRHRSVACAELLAHCLHTVGISSVRVAHEERSSNSGCSSKSSNSSNSSNSSAATAATAATATACSNSSNSSNISSRFAGPVHAQERRRQVVGQLRMPDEVQVPARLRRSRSNAGGLDRLPRGGAPEGALDLGGLPPGVDVSRG